MACNQGDTLKFPNYQGGYEHLWIVATPKLGDPPQVIIVNVTSMKNDSDKTVILDVGDHPHIVHPSVVYYMDARIVKASEVEQFREKAGNGAPTPINQNVLSKIQEGFKNSLYVKPNIKNFFDRAMAAHKIAKTNQSPPKTSS